MTTDPRPTRRASAKKAPAKRAKSVQPSVDAPLPDVGGPTTKELYNALTESTKGVTELVGVLKATEQSNQDSAAWRKKATRANRITQVVVVIAVLGGFLFQVRDSDRERRVKERQEQEDRDTAAQIESNRIESCRNRNASTHFTREQFSGAYDVLDPKHASDLVNHLRAALDKAPPDNDCDLDGRLTTSDYPPGPVR